MKRGLLLGIALGLVGWMGGAMAETIAWCQEVTLSGTLKQIVVKHPLNGEASTVRYLRLDKPILIQPGDCGEDSDSKFPSGKVTDVQINEVDTQLKKQVGKPLEITGELSPPMTAHHVFPAILNPRPARSR